SVTATPIVPTVILQNAPVFVTLFQSILANAAGPQDAANNVAANIDIQKIAGGCHNANDKVTADTAIITYLLIFNNLVSDIFDDWNKSLEILLPINCKKVELEDNAAAKIPLTAMRSEEHT